MATLTSYADLEDAIAAWLGQTNLASARTDLQSNIPIFITMFEATANRRLRTRQMETLTTLTTSSGAVALPADYLDYRRLTWAGSQKVELGYVEPSAIQFLFANTPTDVPEYFTIEAGSIKTMPVDDTASIFQFVYLQKITALASGANWLFTAHPDLYLRGAQVEAAAYGVNDERIPLWKAWRDEVFQEIQHLSDRSRGAGQIIPFGPTP